MCIPPTRWRLKIAVAESVEIPHFEVLNVVFFQNWTASGKIMQALWFHQPESSVYWPVLVRLLSKVFPKFCLVFVIRVFLRAEANAGWPLHIFSTILHYFEISTISRLFSHYFGLISTIFDRNGKVLQIHANFEQTKELKLRKIPGTGTSLLKRRFFSQ